jgi:hypothetical protein
VTVRVEDDDHEAGSTSLQVAVRNVAPTARLVGPAGHDGVRGQVRTFRLGADDASPVDQAAGFSYTIDWGDGSPVQVLAAAPGNGAGIAADHVYDRVGQYTARLSATDKDGVTGPSATYTVRIDAVGLQAESDPSDIAPAGPGRVGREPRGPLPPDGAGGGGHDRQRRDPFLPGRQPGRHPGDHQRRRAGHLPAHRPSHRLRAGGRRRHHRRRSIDRRPCSPATRATTASMAAGAPNVLLGGEGTTS